MAADRLVTITRTDGGGSLPFRLVGSADGSLTGHDAGFEVLPRPGRVGGVRYRGVEPYTCVLPLLTSRAGVLPGVNGSVEDKVQWLRWLAEHRSYMPRPPTVTVTGPVPAEVRGRRWVVNGVQPLEESLIRDEWTGDVAQQRVDLTLLEDVRPVQLTAVQAAQQAAPTPPPSQSVAVLAGEDGLRFAARTLGSAHAWPTVAHLNGMSIDPLTVRPGQVLRLP